VVIVEDTAGVPDDDELEADADALADDDAEDEATEMEGTVSLLLSSEADLVTTVTGVVVEGFEVEEEVDADVDVVDGVGLVTVAADAAVGSKVCLASSWEHFSHFFLLKKAGLNLSQAHREHPDIFHS